MEAAKEAFDDVVENAKEMGSGMFGDKPFKMPSREELLEALETMSLGDEEKEELRKALMDDGLIGQAPAYSWTVQTMMLISFVVVMVSFFSFLFYRLYRSQTEKERKMEEKKQLKMSKRKRK